MKPFRITFLAFFLASIALGSAYAQQADPYSFYPEGVTFDSAIPDPEIFLGHKLGHEPVRHHRMVAYLEALAEVSNRVSVETRGYTHEGRPVLLVIITSPENHARLDDIQAAHVALADPAAGQALTDDMPVVTWLTYGVHGSEASGMDAVVPTAYYLAAAEGDAIDRVLDESVILLWAIHNPDGHARRVAYVEQNRGNVVIRDRLDRVQGGDWPSARTNHCWFDLNRQWLLQTQPASQALVATWHDWKPNISVDYHEMGTNQTYMFFPGIPDQTYPLMPQSLIDLMHEWATGPAAALDQEQRLYYNEESFNSFYIGTGSSYAFVNGAVGVLYEASSARAIEREGDNGLRTYRDNIWKHFRTSLASIISTHRLKDRFLATQKDFFIEAQRLGANDAVAGYVVTGDGDDARLWRFLELMSRHKIRSHVLTQNLRANGRTFPAGASYVIPSNQPQYRMVKSLFEIETEFDSSVFYDVSAWNMALLHNLDYAELGRVRANQLGDKALPPFPAFEAPDVAPFAYVLDWRAYYAPRALNRLLEAGLLPRVMTKPATVRTTRGEVALPRGAIMVSLFGQPLTDDEIHDLMTTISAEDGVLVLSAVSAKTPNVGADLGGESVLPLKPIKPLLITGDGVSPYAAGEVWHLLDYRMNIAVTRRNLPNLVEHVLDEYTHLILPGGWGYELGQEEVEMVKAWVKKGGVVIGIEQGAEIAKGLLKEKKEGEEDADEDEDDEPEPRSDYANKRYEDAEDRIPGTLYVSDLDITHPLGFGYTRRDLPSHRGTSIVLETPDDRYASVAVYKEDPLLSGYSSAASLEKVAGTPMLVAERMGLGSVILFADNPNFRAITYGTNKLFLNALFFGTVFEAEDD
jgi:hypothetical protein